jgi:hypothetical protein
MHEQRHHGIGEVRGSSAALPSTAETCLPASPRIRAEQEPYDDPCRQPCKLTWRARFNPPAASRRRSPTQRCSPAAIKISMVRSNEPDHDEIGIKEVRAPRRAGPAVVVSGKVSTPQPPEMRGAVMLGDPNECRLHGMRCAELVEAAKTQQTV